MQCKVVMEFIKIYLVLCHLATNVLAISSDIISQSKESSCNSFGNCSQNCQKVNANIQCSCVEGFYLNSDNKTCTQNVLDPDWLLLVTLRKQIISFRGITPNFTTPLQQPQNITTNSRSVYLSVTSDVRSNAVYYTDVSEGLEGIYKMIPGKTGKPEVIVDSGVFLPLSVNFDWITGNLYFLDPLCDFIAVCAPNSTRCAVLIQEPTFTMPDGLALHPNKGIMFWVARGGNEVIKKAGMDGSNPTTIISRDLLMPNCITVDEINSRIYWTNTYNEIIESARFDGSERKTIAQAEYPYKIDTFGETIFWTEFIYDRIMMVDKIGGSSTLISEPDRPHGIHAMHNSKQPMLRENSCKNLNCSYMCTLAFSNATCVCPVGLLTNGDFCAEDNMKPKLLVAQHDALLVTRVNTVGKNAFEQLSLPPIIQNIDALVYNPINNSVIISDVISKTIVECKLGKKSYNFLAKDDLVNITLLDIDAVSENLFWYDSGKLTVEVMSLRTSTRVTLMANLTNVHDILFVAEHGALYVSKTGNKENQVHKIFFGQCAKHSVIYNLGNLTQPIQLTFSRENSTVIAAFWNGTHVSIKRLLSSGFHRHLKSYTGGPITDAVLITDQIFLADSTRRIKIIFTASRHEKFVQRTKINFNVHRSRSSKRMLAGMIKNDSYFNILRRDHQCSRVNPKGKTCSHICLPTDTKDQGECFCPTYLVLDKDGLNCIYKDRSRPYLTKVSTCLNDISQSLPNDENDKLKYTISITAKKTRLVYEMTNVSKNGSLQASKHKFDMSYIVLKEDISQEICWSVFVDKTIRNMDFECKDLFGITSLSILFPQNQFLRIESLQNLPMTNNTITNLLENQGTLIYRLFLGVHPSFDILDEQVCFCEETSIRLFDYFDNYLEILEKPVGQKSRLSIKLGLEYHENQIDCCLTTSFNVLSLVDCVVVRWELSPLFNLFSYGLFSEKLNKIVLTNRRLVYSYRSNCTIYIRVLYREVEKYGIEINNLYKSLLAQYVNAWLEEHKVDEIFILKLYPEGIKLPSIIETLKTRVTPMFNEQHYLETVPPKKDDCQGNTLSCANNYILSSISSTFRNINVESSKYLWKSSCPMNSNCELQSSANNRPNLSIVLTHTQDAIEENVVFKELVEYGKAINLDTIYFSSYQYNSWNESALKYVVNLLKSNRIQIGCYISFKGDEWDEGDDNSENTSLNDIINSRCGSLFSSASKVMCHWHATAELFKQLPTFFYNLLVEKGLFLESYPNKTLFPAVTLEDETFSTQNYTANGVSSLYCDQNLKHINEQYEGILNFVGIHKLSHIYLRSAIDNGLISGWWRSIIPDNRYMPGKSNVFPVLVRTNAAVPFKSNEQIPMTYPCVAWTEKAVKSGISFLKNKYIGTTVDMAIKMDSSLKPAELQTLLLFAFGKFPSLELIVGSKLNLKVATLVLTEKFLKVVRQTNSTLIYLEMPITISEHFNHLSEDIAVHYSNWEKYEAMTVLTKFSSLFKSKEGQKGLSLSNCGNEINTNFSTLLKFPLLNKINYIVCGVHPVVPNNLDRTKMQNYLDTMFYMKKYIEHFLPMYAKVEENFDVYFQLNFDSQYNCHKNNTRQNVETYLRFLNDVNQHSSAYNLRYFVKSFEHQKTRETCPQSWWRVTNYDGLANSSVYIDMENEHFSRPTLLAFQLPRIVLEKENVESSANIAFIAIISVVSVLLLCAVVALWYSLHRMRTRYLTEKEMNEFYNGDNDINTESISDGSKWLGMAFPKSYEIPKSHIEFGRLIGSGEFGQVFIGMMNREHEVAIKVPRPNGSKELFKGALSELKILFYVGDGQHTNVILFMGAYTREIEKGKLFIVTEYCKNGSLQNYLRGRQLECRETGKSIVDLYELYRFSYEIALGMAYISEKRVIHGDLSTRNVFLDINYTCKIGDFGLSRKLYEYTEYVKKSEEPLPWRWMAVESLKNMEFTTKSDVWSFGITLWEIFSLGVLPYPGLSWSTGFVNELENGMRMEMATFASEKIHEILLSCWSIHSVERPTFTELAEVFGGQRFNEYTKL